MVGAEPVFAHLAIDEDIVEGIDVSGRLPHLRMHDDRRIEGNDVVAQFDGVAPPRVFDVSL